MTDRTTSLAPLLPLRAQAPGTALAPLRRRIDQLNHDLLRLLQERAAVVAEIGRLKQAIGIQIHDPWREAEMLSALAEEAGGPLNGVEIRQVFSAIFRASRALQERQEVGHEIRDRR